MGFKSLLSKLFAHIVNQQVGNWIAKPIHYQRRVLDSIISNGKITLFGKDHHFNDILTYEEYKEAVPLVEYEKFKPYIEKIISGEENVIWPGKPIYFATTSGTTSGEKYIPITKDSIHNHINTARNALLLYIAKTGNSHFCNGKMVFLSGNPVLKRKGGILTGRLSGIVNHHIPGYLHKNKLPTPATNSIEDWETKIDAIVDETISENVTLISGIPPWVQMYYDRLIERSGSKISDLFSNYSLFVHGGVNFKPYKAKLEAAIGKEIDSIETYPASEGFIAFQDANHHDGLLLNINSGIFYEFVRSDEIFSDNPVRISLEDVEINTNYAIILNSNAGLYGYIIGDTVKFLSKAPYRLVVTGRISHFLSAFGEHVISEEVGSALSSALSRNDIDVIDFTVAPQVNPEHGNLPYHEWFIEFDKLPEKIDELAAEIDLQLQNLNPYYKDLVQGNVLQRLVITPIKPNGFRLFMKEKGKLGGQNKLPHLSNDRLIANELSKWRYTLGNQ